ncbi:MAG TPA: hypothetical protein VK942_06135 [Actinomycetes bacterium]|nr:hypothetical protein [Actinomycetes bacterium]
MLNQVIHPSPAQVRWTGLAAMVGGILGLVFAPLYSLAYFATDDGAADATSPWVQAWAEPARDLFGPLLTFASPDVVRLTYFKLFLFITMGMLAGLVGLHARQAQHGGRLERWGFRASFVGLLLLTIGAFSGYWSPLLDFSFVTFIVPGLLLVVFGSPLFGLGTWRAGVAPRIGAGLLIVGGPALFLISEIATLGGSLVLVYLAWVVLGHSLWSATPTPAHTVAPSSAPSRPDRR